METTGDLELQRPELKTQSSTLSSRNAHAVCVRKACKRYGTKKNPHVVLDGLNMTVPKGTIYGLLGASGCGKSTLLSCIVGRKRLNSGELSVLGGHPGSRGSGVPGPRIGYMPQETALYGEFTIRETLKYFGWISNLTTEKVEERLAFLEVFLMLPSADQQVKTLSGGQQRRVSFAAALLHEPELLILDEPTVGVDPLIRQNIWDHLVHITKTLGTTVIITTHYIDETRQAHMIGLMRGGYFLAEASPNDLMAQYAAESLEDVFLKLSVIQNQGKRRRSSIAEVVVSSITISPGVVNEAAVVDEAIADVDDAPAEASGVFGDNVLTSRPTANLPEIPPPELPSDKEPPMAWRDYFKVANPRHMQALVWKNALWMWRNYPVMMFVTVLPVVQMIIFCLSIGKDPIDLPISVVNRELDRNETCATTTSCNSTRLSCNFLDYLERRTLQLSFYDTLEDANDQVRLGYSWATVYFKHNFSEALASRLYKSRTISSEDLASSEVDIYQDISNQNIGTFLKRDLYSAFIYFFQDYLETCNISRKFGTIPIRFNDPVYGYRNPNFTDFSVPGIILTMVFFLSVALTAGAMLLERNEGILERSLVNGITAVELLFGHVITLFIVMSIQTVLVLVFTFVVFGMTMNGSVMLVVVLLLLTGLCGMCFGFAVSCVCETERTATYVAMGSFMPIIMLCGIIWPIEAMHYLLQIIAYFLPLTKSTESLRSILQRGWSFEEPVVYAGFVSTILWIAIFMTLSILLLKFKKG